MSILRFPMGDVVVDTSEDEVNDEEDKLEDGELVEEEDKFVDDNVGEESKELEEGEDANGESEGRLAAVGDCKGMVLNLYVVRGLGLNGLVLVSSEVKGEEFGTCGVTPL